MNELILDPSLDVWFGEVIYEYEDDDDLGAASNRGRARYNGTRAKYERGAHPHRGPHYFYGNDVTRRYIRVKFGL